MSEMLDGKVNRYRGIACPTCTANYGLVDRCVCYEVSIKDVREGLALALADQTPAMLYELKEWCEEITGGTGEDLSGSVSLLFCEYRNPDCAVVMPRLWKNEAYLRRVLQSLLDIGCAPFHWVCGHEPKHELQDSAISSG